MSKFFSVETRSGEPVAAGGRSLIPFAQSLRIQIPGGHGGLIWNRPVSVLAISSNGQEQVIPIRDVTRQIQWAFMGLTMLTAILFGLTYRNRQKKLGK